MLIAVGRGRVIWCWPNVGEEELDRVTQEKMSRRPRIRVENPWVRSLRSSTEPLCKSSIKQTEYCVSVVKNKRGRMVLSSSFGGWRDVPLDKDTWEPITNLTEAKWHVMVIRQLGKNCIQTHRDNADVLRHIIKNVSSRLVGIIQSPAPVTNWELFFFTKNKDSR